MNVTHNTNAKKGAKEDFNAFKEFTDIETDSLVLVAAMTHFKMKKVDGMNVFYFVIKQYKRLVDFISFQILEAL